MSSQHASERRATAANERAARVDRCAKATAMVAAWQGANKHRRRCLDSAARRAVFCEIARCLQTPACTRRAAVGERGDGGGCEQSAQPPHRNKPPSARARARRQASLLCGDDSILRVMFLQYFAFSLHRAVVFAQPLDFAHSCACFSRLLAGRRFACRRKFTLGDAPRARSCSTNEREHRSDRRRSPPLPGQRAQNRRREQWRALVHTTRRGVSDAPIVVQLLHSCKQRFFCCLQQTAAADATWPRDCCRLASFFSSAAARVFWAADWPLV